MEKQKTKRLLLLFIVALIVSGFTAIPVAPLLKMVLEIVPSDTIMESWLLSVLHAYKVTADQYPFLLYGYDWLAFAHFVLAILFIGPYRHPVKNIWVIEFGLIACLLVIPFALIAGYFRAIPFWWQLIDCSFGIFGGLLLWTCHRNIQLLALQTSNSFKPEI